MKTKTIALIGAALLGLKFLIYYHFNSTSMSIGGFDFQKITANASPVENALLWVGIILVGFALLSAVAGYNNK